jgi:hypothetical protein
MPTYTSHNVEYKVREYINGEEYDMVMNALFNLAKDGKSLNDLDMSNMLAMYPTLYPVLRQVSQSLIESPPVPNIQKLDAELIQILNNYSLSLFLNLANRIKQNGEKPVESSDPSKKKS